MPADIGEMFYTGETPWHGLGMHLAKPATVEEALRAGGLDWQVDEVDLMTADDPPSPVPKRKAIVRLDRPAGHEGRVLGVAHRGFKPLQNRDGAVLFDAIFGHGEAVYHTGGYLGNGEVVWLLAKIDKKLEIGSGDFVEPYALFANSHDGSMAFNIRLNAVLEYVDHYRESKGSKISYALLGDGMDLKVRAFRMIGQYASAV